jgi:hypothetical protein
LLRRVVGGRQRVNGGSVSCGNARQVARLIGSFVHGKRVVRPSGATDPARGMGGLQLKRDGRVRWQHMVGLVTRILPQQESSHKSTRPVDGSSASNPASIC